MKKILLDKHNTQEAINQAVYTINQGGIVIYPTETCYGVGIDSTNPTAVAKLLQYKSKRDDKPLSIAVCDKAMAQNYAVFNETAHNIFDNYLPGPITVVCCGLHKVAQGIESNTGTLGIRWPDYRLIEDIIRGCGVPITATSANASYKKTPYCIADIFENISDRQKSLLDLVLDAGILPKRKTSTVIDTTLEGIQILREGDIHFINCQDVMSHSESETNNFARIIFQEIQSFIGQKLIVIELYGDLGAGKTYFSKFFAQHLGIQTNLVSPTYTICNEYNLEYQNSKIGIFHLDVYRLYSPEEMQDLGMERIFQPPNILLIEWANKISKYIAPFIQDAVLIKIKLEHVNPTTRKIQYSFSGIQK